jgi:alpha-L-fucosidase
MSTPFKRDVMKEMADAARENGIRMCWYHSILDWHDPDAQSEATFPTYEWRMRAQVNELLSNYGDIGVMWFDGDWIKEWNAQRGRRLYDLCRSIQPNVIVNNRVTNGRKGMEGFTAGEAFAGDYGTPEQQVPDVAPPPGVDWETCMTMNGTWGFKTDDVNFKSTQALIRMLIDVASKGGNFLLNVGPTGDGEIPDASAERLQQIGKWMALNGESIHGTTASPFGNAKLPWGKVTQKPGKLYLHVLNWPKEDLKTILLPVRNKVSKAYLLAEPDPPLEFASSDLGVTVRLPQDMPDPDATVVALEIEGTPEVIGPAATKPTTNPTTNPTK